MDSFHFQGATVSEALEGRLVQVHHFTEVRVVCVRGSATAQSSTSDPGLLTPGLPGKYVTGPY